MQFQEIIALPSHVQISVCSMSCASNAASSKRCRNIETLAIYLSANLPLHCVAVLQVFPRDGKAVIYENCIFFPN